MPNLVKFDPIFIIFWFHRLNCLAMNPDCKAGINVHHLSYVYCIQTYCSRNLRIIKMTVDAQLPLRGHRRSLRFGIEKFKRFRYPDPQNIFLWLAFPKMFYRGLFSIKYFRWSQGDGGGWFWVVEGSGWRMRDSFESGSRARPQAELKRSWHAKRAGGFP